jgi:hypothetical protein
MWALPAQVRILPITLLFFTLARLVLQIGTVVPFFWPDTTILNCFSLFLGRHPANKRFIPHLVTFFKKTAHKSYRLLSFVCKSCWGYQLNLKRKATNKRGISLMPTTQNPEHHYISFVENTSGI